MTNEKSSGSSLLPKRRHNRSLDIPNIELEPVRKKNSKYHDFHLMYYLRRILQITILVSPENDVANETMKRNITLAEERKESYIATTYDSAIAKPACQLQDSMQPKYDNVFVCFGAFHIMFRHFLQLDIS